VAGWYIGVILGLISIILLIRGLYEPHKLEITHTVLGEGKDSLKLLLLSDIHAAFFFLSKEKIGEVIKTENPDAVVFTGDLASGERDYNQGLAIMSSIKAYADTAGIPLYAVEGNHDPAGIGEKLSAFGVKFLANSSEPMISHDGSRWLIAGLSDIRNSEPSYRDAVDTSKNFPNGNKLPQVVLAHNPDCIFEITDKLSEDHPDIFLLSGHFHGGQIWMPFGLEYKIMRNERMSREGYRKGPFEKDGIRGYISRGLGCVIVPLRFLSKPEAAVIELRSDGSGLL